MVGTVTVVTVAASLCFFGGLAVGLFAVFRRLERDRYPSTGRRKLARAAFGFGTVLSVTTLVGLATAFTLDVGPVFGADPVLVGAGAVVVASLPLAFGLVLGLDGAAHD